MLYTRNGDKVVLTLAPSDVATLVAPLGPTHFKTTCPFVSAFGLVDVDKVIEAALARKPNIDPSTAEIVKVTLSSMLEEGTKHSDPVPGAIRLSDGGVEIPLTARQIVSVVLDIERQLDIPWAVDVKRVLSDIRDGMFLFTDDEVVDAFHYQIAEVWGEEFNESIARKALELDRLQFAELESRKAQAAEAA